MYVAVAVFDSSDNYLEPIWRSVTPPQPSDGGDGNSNHNVTPPDNGNDDDRPVIYDYLMEILGSATAAIVGLLFFSFRKKKLNRVLNTISETYQKFYSQPTIAWEKLNNIKIKCEQDLKKNRLSDSQYLIIEKKLDELMKMLDSIIHHQTFKTSEYESFPTQIAPSDVIARATNGAYGYDNIYSAPTQLDPYDGFRV